MSAIPQRGPHVRDLFVKSRPGAAGGLAAFEADSHESHNTYDLSGKKKRRAPAAPVTLGQYKPKILSESSHEANVSVSHGNSQSAAGPAAGSSRDGPGVGPLGDSGSRPSARAASDRSRPFIVGDKDTPLVLPASSPDASGLEPSIRDLRVRGVGANNEGEGMIIGSSNPLYDLQAPNTSSTGGTSLLSNGTTSIAVLEKTRKEEEEEERAEAKDGEPDGVFIPAPDYEEEEKTMVFSEEPEDDELSSEISGKKVFKEYYGEDFAQYLSDEENGLDDELWHPRQKRSARHVPDPRKSRTEVKRSHYKKRENTLPAKKSDFGSKDKGFQNSNSLRNFSFADSKFGTVMNGRDGSSSGSRPQSVHSVSDDSKAEAHLFIHTGSSYEQFLRSKNGEDFPPQSEPPESPVGAVPSSSSSRYTRPSHKKDTLWKKLTWRFKKPAKNSFDLDS